MILKLDLAVRHPPDFDQSLIIHEIKNFIYFRSIQKPQLNLTIYFMGLDHSIIFDIHYHVRLSKGNNVVSL